MTWTQERRDSIAALLPCISGCQPQLFAGTIQMHSVACCDQREARADTLLNAGHPLYAVRVSPGEAAEPALFCQLWHEQVSSAGARALCDPWLESMTEVANSDGSSLLNPDRPATTIHWAVGPIEPNPTTTPEDPTP